VALTRLAAAARRAPVGPGTRTPNPESRTRTRNCEPRTRNCEPRPANPEPGTRTRLRARALRRAGREPRTANREPTFALMRYVGQAGNEEPRTAAATPAHCPAPSSR
jgi:hypothetical protein